MPRCAREDCARWRPELLARRRVAGLRFEGSWFCSPACLQRAVRDRLEGAGRTPAAGPQRVRSRLGAILVHQGAIHRDELAPLLTAHLRSGERLGSVAVRMTQASELDVLRALARQEGLSYLTSVDMSSLPRVPCGLSGGTVRALALVPIAIDEPARRLHVACAAPVPRLALSAMSHLTGWSTVPFLVLDHVLAELIAAYEASAQGRARTTAVNDVTGAAARITRGAAEGAVDRIAHARCDRHLWVRMHGAGGSEDLLLPIAAGEDACRAALTSH